MASEDPPAGTVGVLEGLRVNVPQEFTDHRGRFFVAFNRDAFRAWSGYEGDFVQDNQSTSTLGVLRGLHYQAAPMTQGKLVRVLRGRIWDVAVDIRRPSATCGEWFGIELSAENRKQLWIPAGFAHGFVTLTEIAEVLYRTTSSYSPEHERTIQWDDPQIGIEWPLDTIGVPTVSDKDANGESFSNADLLG